MCSSRANDFFLHRHRSVTQKEVERIDCIKDVVKYKYNSIAARRLSGDHAGVQVFAVKPR